MEANIEKEMPDWLALIYEVRNYHKAMQENFGISPPGKPRSKKKGWSIRDTALHFKKSRNWIHQSLKIAEFLDLNTEIKPMSRNSIWKIVKDVS